MPKVKRIALDRPRTVLGVDPGTSPALAVLTRPDRGNYAHQVERLTDYSFNEKEFRDVLAEWRPDLAVIEQVSPMAAQGIASTSRFMACWGVARGICVGMGIPYILVTPQVWKRDILEAAGYDMGRDENDKDKRKDIQKASAVRFVRDRFPGLNLFSTGKQGASHDVAESVCLAFYGMFVHVA